MFGAAKSRASVWIPKKEQGLGYEKKFLSLGLTPLRKAAPTSSFSPSIARKVLSGPCQVDEQKCLTSGAGRVSIEQ